MATNAIIDDDFIYKVAKEKIICLTSALFNLSVSIKMAQQGLNHVEQRWKKIACKCCHNLNHSFNQSCCYLSYALLILQRKFQFFVSDVCFTRQQESVKCAY